MMKEQSKIFKPFGTDLNKDGTLGESISPEGEPIGFYKGKKEDYGVIIDELEERATANQEGRTAKSRSLFFSGVDFKQLKKS